MPTIVYVLDTAHLSHNPTAPAVAIQSFSDGKNEYRNQSRAVLPQNTDKVTIRFTASSLLIPERAQFRYRLSGIDHDWQSDNGQRFAVYSRLPPGEYAFQVIASNNDGVWNQEGASVIFTIPPSFVQSFGFKALCTAAAVGLLWIVYRVRLHQITEQVRRRMYERLDERTRIARDLHDTFFQGIQGLFLRFNTGTALLKADEPARAIFEEALKQSDRVMLEGRELMLDLREGLGTTHSLADTLSIVSEDSRKHHPAEFAVAVVGDPRPLHPLVFEELHRFGREALANAFRHAHAKRIEVELHYERNQLRLRVRDDGVGIDPAVLSSGFRAGHWDCPVCGNGRNN
jgi:signal transduction histidine kinase